MRPGGGPREGDGVVLGGPGDVDGVVLAPAGLLPVEQLLDDCVKSGQCDIGDTVPQETLLCVAKRVETWMPSLRYTMRVARGWTLGDGVVLDGPEIGVVLW